MVLEIGGGWGGFAYQFKTLFPKTTYVIVDFPELFLFSATYLLTVFPERQGAVLASGRARRSSESEDVDFVFVPDAARRCRPAHARPDLLVNLVSFQEMTTSQVERYTELAAATGCPALYSLNRDRSVYNDEIESVSAILSRHYDLREVPVLGSGLPQSHQEGQRHQRGRGATDQPCRRRGLSSSRRHAQAGGRSRRCSGHRMRLHSSASA